MNGDYVGQTAAVGNAPWWSGAGYGLYGGGGRFADFASNAVRTDRNMTVAQLGLDRVSDQNEETRRNLGEARVMDNITASCNRISDQQVNGEFRTLDRLRDQDREIAANAREAAKCCCDLKLQMCEDKAELKAEILAVETRNIQRDLDNANRQLSEQTIINTISQRCGCAQPNG